MAWDEMTERRTGNGVERLLGTLCAEVKGLRGDFQSHAKRIEKIEINLTDNTNMLAEHRGATRVVKWLLTTVVAIGGASAGAWFTSKFM